MILDQRKTFIHTLRVISGDRDTLALQSRLEHTLCNLDLYPTSLPSSAIVCIRKLSDPVPGRLSANGMNLRGLAGWGEAARARVAETIARAARPAYSAVAANAEAVLFSDRAELLACLASDWCEGSIAERWWWQTICHGTDLAREVIAAWLQAPEYVPAALHHLAQRQQVTAFILRLHEPDVSSLLQTLIFTFGLHELHSGLTREANRDRDGVLPSLRVRTLEQPVADLVLHPQLPFLLSQRSAPWRQWVPEARGMAVDVDRQCVLGIGLSLHRAPAVARSRSFAREVVAWYREASASNRDTPRAQLQVKEREISAAQSRARDSVSGADESQQLWADFDSLPARGASTDERRSVPGSSSPVPLTSAGFEPETAQAPEVEMVPSSAGPSEIRTDTRIELPLAPKRGRFDQGISTSPSTDDHQSPSDDETQIETELGGLFYLVNLGLHLNLYADFTRPLEQGVNLPLWDFIAFVGRRLLRGQFLDDPVWGLLARLAGRVDNQPPGQHFEPVGEWRIPAEWLRPFDGTSRWNWSVERERLRVMHSEGFCIVDVRVGGDTLQSLQNETRQYTGIADFQLQETELLPAEDVEPLDRWLNWLVPFITARLRRALGLCLQEDAVHVLFRGHARVRVTPTHLDVHLVLAELPIEVRLAGLDRDPGWVPAAGRFVRFQYA